MVIRPRSCASSGASADEPVDERLTLLGAKWLEEERRRVELASAPARPRVEQLRPRDAEQEDACVPREICDVLHEVDEDRLGPLEIVDHDDLRAFGRACLEEPPKGELRLRRRRADDGVGLDADRDQDLDQRPVRDALPVREAPPTKDVGCVAHALEEVRDEARLPDAGRPEEREEPTGGVRNRILVVAPETLALAVSPDKRRLEPPRERVGVVRHLEEPKCLDQLGLPLQREWLDRLDLHRVAHEQPGLGADQRLRRGCRLLEARSDVDRVSGDERLTLAADDDLARVDPDPRLEAVRRDRGTHLRCCTHRAESVVLVRHRDPETAMTASPTNFSTRATVTLDDRAEILEIPAHPRAQRLGIGRLAERRRPHEIAEENGDDLALLACVSLAKSGVAHALQNLASSGSRARKLGQGAMGGVYGGPTRDGPVSRGGCEGLPSFRAHVRGQRPGRDGTPPLAPVMTGGAWTRWTAE